MQCDTSHHLDLHRLQMHAVQCVLQRGGQPAPSPGHPRWGRSRPHLPRMWQEVFPRGQPQGPHHAAWEGGEPHLLRVWRWVQRSESAGPSHEWASAGAWGRPHPHLSPVSSWVPQAGRAEGTHEAALQDQVSVLQQSLCSFRLISGGFLIMVPSVFESFGKIYVIFKDLKSVKWESFHWGIWKFVKFGVKSLHELCNDSVNFSDSNALQFYVHVYSLSSQKFGCRQIESVITDAGGKLPPRSWKNPNFLS